MRIAVLGATGRTGQPLVAELLHRGHEVTVLVRTPEKLGAAGAGTDMDGDLKGRKDRMISSMIRRVGGAMAADKAQEYRILVASNLDWTLVRPPRLVDGPATRRMVHDAHIPGRSSSIRRADLAVFLADVIEQGLSIRQSPFVSTG